MPHTFQNRLHLLGSFQIETPSGLGHFGTRKVESLIAYLALHPERHTREKLATLFWGDSIDAQARLSLRVALSTLRKELGDTFLITDRDTIQLNPNDSIWIDAREFQQALTDDPASAIDLYLGDLVPDFYDDWILQERERLRTLYLDTLLRLAQDARSQSQYARATELACRVLATDHANEKAHQHLIFCHLALGNRTAALKQYEDCQGALRDEMDVEPSPETTALYVRAQTEATNTKSPEALFTNLPTPMTSFVGRVDEIVQVKQLLATTRLLTLIGAGGCGKTRLTIQVATELAATERFKHGVWWVDLAALTEPALVTQAVAMVFNVSESPTTPLIAVLSNYLRAKELLIVLDNCEHLLGACAQLVGTILSACPKVRMVVTSREPLSISGEVAWRVPSLALPDAEQLPPLVQLRQYEAIQLFAERAFAVATNWRLAENITPVAQVCVRLDGIPLAIELAAAQLKNFPVQQIATRLDDRFNLLSGSNRAVLPRHQTLRATMDWSYDLLSDAERALLRRLSVFAGGWTLDAVKVVCADIEAMYTLSLPDILTLLIDKSLVAIEHKDTQTHYRLLETVRQYVREKLFALGETEQTQTRHCTYFVDWIEQASFHLRHPDALEWRDRIEWEYDNLRAAFEFVVNRDSSIALRITWGVHLFWQRYGFVSEGRAWLERLLPQIDAREPIALRARAWNLAGYLAYLQMDIPNAIRMSEQALELAQSAEAEWDIGFAFQRLGWAYEFVRTPNKPRSVVDCHTQGLEIFQRLGDEEMITESMFGLGHKLGNSGELERGAYWFQQAIDRHRKAGNRYGEAVALAWLSLSYTLAKNFDTAEPYAQQALAVARQLRSKDALGISLIFLARCVLRKDEPRRAMPYAVEALRIYHSIGSVSVAVMILEEVALCIGLVDKPESAARILGAIQFQWETKRASSLLIPGIYDRQWKEIRARLGDEEFEKKRTEGRALSLDQTVDLALEMAKTIG